MNATVECRCNGMELWLQNRANGNPSEKSINPWPVDEEGYTLCPFCGKVAFKLALTKCPECGKYFKGPRPYFSTQKHFDYECEDC